MTHALTVRPLSCSRFAFFFFRLLRCGGAHAPTHYVFGPEQEMEVNPSPQ